MDGRTPTGEIKKLLKLSIHEFNVYKTKKLKD